MDSLESERRGIGVAMEAERTGRQVQQAINQLAKPQTPSATLKPLETKGSLASRRGRGSYDDTAQSKRGGGGIASPLTEKTKEVDGKKVPDREYWPGGLPSSDGLLIYPAVKTFNLIDAGGAAVQLQLANPAGE